jgi:hypothetical protein
MRFLKDCLCVLSVLFLLALCFLSTTLVTQISAIALLISSLVVIYLLRTEEYPPKRGEFDSQATLSNE